MITAIAYLAAFFMFILLVWMIRDYFLPKKQEFYAEELSSLSFLRQELELMEKAIKRHLELAGQAQQTFTGTECAAICEHYAETSRILAEIKYDRSVFVDKGIKWPGQRCYDIYLRLSRSDVPLGFTVLNGQVATLTNSDQPENEPLLGPDDAQCQELAELVSRFNNSKIKLYNRLEIYK